MLTRMRRMNLTPRIVTEDIKNFCLGIQHGADPIYINITPEPDCQPGNCFFSVKTKVERFGGRIQFGWAIWEWPQVYVEAEHHGVYEPESGPPWIDITPSGDPQIRRRLFLPDDGSVYNFDNRMRKDNIRHALADDPMIRDLFRAGEHMTEINNRIPELGDVTLTGENARDFQANWRVIGNLLRDIALKYCRQNEPCVCGSGTKFKDCHGNKHLRHGGLPGVGQRD